MYRFKIKLLKNVVLISLALIIGLPLFFFVIIYPAFSKLQTQNVENEAIRTAQHLRSIAVREAAGQEELMVSEDLTKEIFIIKRDFKLEKVRILSPAREVIYSTAPEDIGLKNDSNYFHTTVAKGRVHSEEVHPQTRSADERVATDDIVEVFVPLMSTGRFLGAFEFHYDITDRQKRLNRLFRQSFSYLFAFVGALFILNILLAVNVNKTITAQRRAETALQESERKNRLVVENANESIVVIQDGKIKFLNRKVQEVWGYSDKELQNRPFFEFIHSADRATVLQRHRKRMQGEDVSNIYQTRIVDKLGHERWAEVNTIRVDWEGRPAALSFINDVTARKRAEDALRENEEYLRTVMKTIQTGVMIIDPKTSKIVDANPYVAAMFGCEVYELLGRDCHEHMCLRVLGLCPRPEPCERAEIDDCVLRTLNRGAIQVRRSAARATIKGHDYIVQSMQDISDIKALLRQQEINIDLAKNILGVINAAPPRYTDIGDGLSLFVDAAFLPCHAAGGDHFFVRRLAAGNPNGHGKTVVSLKDQSGHEVGCVLRSILTDLIHNGVLNNKNGSGIEEVTACLNDEICHSGLFQEEDFCTSINAELDHKTLNFRYVSCGHPPFFLIRGNEIVELPRPHGAGTNLPMAVMAGRAFSAGECRLQPGDRLIFYTDGLVEMPFRKRRKIITIQELRKIIGEIVQRDPQAPVSEIMSAMLGMISGLSGEEVFLPDSLNGAKNSSGDDITLLGLEVEDRRNYRQQVWRPQDQDDVCRFIGQVYARLKPEWLQRGYGAPELRLRTACEETILNAWRHGNRQAADKAVTVRWRFGNDFHLEVLDEGRGFDYDNVPDPTAEENITKFSGRGIFLVNRLAESVGWKQEGSHIVMSYKKNAQPTGVQTSPRI